MAPATGSSSSILSFDVRFYVCNPARHQWTHLPAPLPSLWFAGFHHHEPTGEYRALFYRDDCTDDQWPGTDYYILVPNLFGSIEIVPGRNGLCNKKSMIYITRG